ncbi:NADP-dependent mannitol dehydrogenase [Lecanosticta acicola]|uniref:NADP-dependent mannitol dehydrogenase n=1 Tax=Lecanosticta acicola TaxID=111012 RepID=A0AAI8Z2C2_9PEZI|nr:NADP-dependent mannitol dehydrogenase [Lecanosticta acicola]
MVQAVPLENENGGTAMASGTSMDAQHHEVTPNLSTLPPPDFNWQISLQDKVIAITGANRGIGLGIAEVCLANQARAVYSLDLMDPSEDFEALSKRNPGRFKYKQMDVTEEASVQAAVDAIVAAEGALHGMVCNAGMTKHQPALDFSLEQVRQLFELNVFGVWNCATAAARTFIARGIKGSIVCTASMTSYRPNRAAPSAPYGGTKAAVRNMTHTLAMEWAKHGIRINSISPGFVRTAMTYYVERAPDWDLKMQYYGGMPRLALPQELGGAYVYLLSDQASYTTGIDIPIAEKTHNVLPLLLPHIPPQETPPPPQKQITLSRKIIAITGANRGIGLGIADCCLSNAAEAVYSIDISASPPGEEFEALAKKYPGRLHAIRADVTREAEVTEAVEKILREAGGLHGMVVNAGRTRHKAALEFTEEEIEGLWRVNLFGSFYCARVAARAFIKQDVKGSIVFTASMASYRPNKRVPSAPYGASKAGVRNMTHTLSMEWAKYGIRVNSVSPGLVKTAMTYWVEQQPDWEQQLKYYGGIPRLAEVEELGGAYVYLLSDAASYTTSIDIPVNGVIGSKLRSSKPGKCELTASSLLSQSHGQILVE